MKSRAPIQDAIDRRNFKQDLASTVIKRSRVRFITEDDASMTEEEEILERIMAENELYEDDMDNQEEHYGLVEEPDLDLSDVSEDVLSAADEILARLQREAEEDEELRRQEWLKKIANGDV